MKLALVLLTCSLHAQDLTQEEQWATVIALHLSGEVWTDKAPTEAELDAPTPAVFRLVHSDAPLRVHTAAWQAPLPVSPRAIAYFSPGPNVGKGFYQWLLKACNPSDSFTTELDSGWIEIALAANKIAIQDTAEAKISNELQRNKSRPIIGTQLVQTGAAGMTGLIAMRTIAASSGWGAAAFGASLVAGALVNYFKSVSPKEFSERFQDSMFLDGSYTLEPKACTPRVTIFSKTKRGAAPMGNVPIY